MNEKSFIFNENKKKMIKKRENLEREKLVSCRVDQYEKRNCITMSFDELQGVVADVTNGLKQVSYETDGLSLEDSQKADDEERYFEKKTLKQILSEYLDVSVTCVHADDEFPITIWIAYEDKGIVIKNGTDIDISKISSCSYRSMSECEEKCERYYSCDTIAVANDLLVEYEKVQPSDFCKRGEKKNKKDNGMITRTWKVYSYDSEYDEFYDDECNYNECEKKELKSVSKNCKSVSWDFSGNWDKVCSIEILNSDITMDDKYSIVQITRESRKACEMEFEGQISEGYFENYDVVECFEVNDLKIPEEWVLKLMLARADYLGWSSSLEPKNREVILEYDFETQVIDCELDPKSPVISLLSKIRAYAESKEHSLQNKKRILELFEGMKQAALLHGYALDELQAKQQKKTEGKEIKLREFSVEICDIFEDLLEQHDITIPDPAREGAPEEARLYGDSWADTEDSVVAILSELVKIIKDNPEAEINMIEL